MCFPVNFAKFLRTQRKPPVAASVYLLLQAWLNTRNEGEKSLNSMQGNVNLQCQVIM